MYTIMKLETLKDNLQSCYNIDDVAYELKSYAYQLWYTVNVDMEFGRRYCVAFYWPWLPENLPGRLGVYRNYSGGWIHSGISESEYHHCDKKYHDDMQKLIDACRITMEHVESMQEDLEYAEDRELADGSRIRY